MLRVQRVTHSRTPPVNEARFSVIDVAAEELRVQRAALEGLVRSGTLPTTTIDDVVLVNMERARELVEKLKLHELPAQEPAPVPAKAPKTGAMVAMRKHTPRKTPQSGVGKKRKVRRR